MLMSTARSLVLKQRPEITPAEDATAGSGAGPSFEETRRTLVSSARRRFGAVPAELIVDHVLAMTEKTDFAVREAALAALVRRMSFALRDGLSILARPPRGAMLGPYSTARAPAPRARRPRADAPRLQRPYVTSLDSLRPLSGSCDCPDFVRSSLGLCKHLLIVLDAVHRSGVPAEAERARARRPRDAKAQRARLSWSPSLPLQGPLDRATGLRLELPVGTRRAAVLPPAILRCFEVVTGDLALRPAALEDLRTRAALFERLHSAIVDRGSTLEATPAARRIVEEERDRALRRARFVAHAPRATRELASLARKLYPYQREGVARMLETGRLLLADDMGLGKTTQAIAACHALWRAKRVRKGLVIAPASLKPQWLREWQETTSVPIRLVEGSPEERRRIYREHRTGFLVVGYEQLLRDIAEIQALRPEMVVVDEAQRIKNYATKSAAYVKALDPEYRLVLTGTPMENRLEELASILDWVDDVALSPKWRLVPWHTTSTSTGDRGTSGTSGARNLDTLRARIGMCTLRRLRRDVIGQLPSRTDTRVPIEMTAQQRDAHDELSLPIAVLARKAAKRPLTQPEFLRLMSLLNQQRIISNGLAQQRFDDVWPMCARSKPDAALLEGLFAPKLLEVRRLCADLAVDQERKVVVFSQWRRMLRLAEWSVRDLLAAEGCRAVFFTGAESPAQRTRAIAEFHDDPNVRVMFLSDAGGVGLNLQRAASACINLEMPWNPAVLEQRVGRIHRLGQESPIDVYNLVNEYGIESRISTLVGVKQALFSGVFDGTTDEVSFESAGSFASRVEKLVDPEILAEAPERAAIAALPASADIEEEAEEDGAGAEGERAEDRRFDAPAEREPPTSAVQRAATTPGTRELLAGVRVERTESGGLRIEAPPEAAQWMATAFEAMAMLMRGAPQGG
ncbi:MAG: rapA [Myxococcaceae bacterium]|nr:rapA [Myxococcaceae bacterium]